MQTPKLPMGGACRCRKIRFEIRVAPLMTIACHCLDCQKMSSSAFSITAMVPANGFHVLEGEPEERSVPGSRRQHFFCPDCMSWLFTRLEGVDARVNVRPTLCDDTSWVTPFIETMTTAKLPWVTTPAVHSFEAFPSPQEFQLVMAEFARRQAGCAQDPGSG